MTGNAGAPRDCRSAVARSLNLGRRRDGLDGYASLAGKHTLLARFEEASNLVGAESPILQESRLPSSLVMTVGHRLAKALAPHPGNLGDPVEGALIEISFDETRFDPTLTKLVADPSRPVPLCDPTLHERLGKSRVAKQPLPLELGENPVNVSTIKTLALELPGELGPRMLASREQAQGLSPHLVAGLFQASASSTSALGAGAPRTTSRIWASILCATSGLALRYSRTLSRPWPMRSPL